MVWEVGCTAGALLPAAADFARVFKGGGGLPSMILHNLIVFLPRESRLGCIIFFSVSPCVFGGFFFFLRCGSSFSSYFPPVSPRLRDVFAFFVFFPWVLVFMVFFSPSPRLRGISPPLTPRLHDVFLPREPSSSYFFSREPSFSSYFFPVLVFVFFPWVFVSVVFFSPESSSSSYFPPVSLHLRGIFFPVSPSSSYFPHES